MHKLMTKEFRAIDNTIVIVEIMGVRITVISGNFKSIYSCYDFNSISELHNSIISENVLNDIKYYVNNNCIYLKPKEEEGQMSLF